MSKTLNTYRLTGYLFLIKERCTNGILDLSKPDYILARQIGVSTQAHKKFFKQALELGLIRKKSYYARTISWRAILKINGLIDKNRKFKRLMNDNASKPLKEMTLQQITAWIYQSMQIWTFQQQEHKIECKRKLIKVAKRLLANHDNKISSKKYDELIKIAKEQNKSVNAVCADLAMDLDYIKTGSIHLSKKIGLSQNTANRALNKLCKANLIERTIIGKKYDVRLSHEGFDALKEKVGLSNLFVNSRTNTIDFILGSRVKLIGICLSNSQKLQNKKKKNNEKAN